MSQFRKNNKRSLISKLMTLYYRRRVGKCGAAVNFDSIVNLMRFPRNIQFGDGVYVKSGAKLCPCNEKAKITVGENTTIGYNTMIFSSVNIQIGANCMIAPNVYVVDSDHGTDRSLQMNLQENTVSKVYIGDDVWLATGVVVLKGAVIPEGCIVAANSVVKGELEAYGIYAGVPARKVGERK